MPGLDALAVGGGVTDPRDARHAVGGLLAVHGPGALDVRTGVLAGPGSTPLVTGTSKTGPKMSVLIGPHVLVGSRGQANGPYLGPTLDAALEVDVDLAPASGSRIDVVWGKQQDPNSGVPTPDAGAGPAWGVLKGTATTGTPAKPDLSTVVGAVELATVTVAAGATSTNGSGVTIANTARQTVARGGILPVRNQAEEDELTQYASLEVYRIDTGQVKISNGTAFAVAYDPPFNPANAPRGYRAGQSFTSAGPAGVGNTESMFDAVTFTAVAGRRYKITWDGVWIANTFEVTAKFTIRSASGVAVTNSGALAHSRFARSPSNIGNFIPLTLTTTLTGLSGQTTVGVGVLVALGGGTISIPGAADNIRRLLVEDIGS